jgi:hypothetical protein
MHLIFYSINHNNLGQKNEAANLLRVNQISLLCKLSSMSAAATEDTFDLE